MSYEISIDSFQGPLDLLLHLIEKNKVDIYDIPISQITDQYMEYIKKWKELNLDVASEFLVMAATLLEIKSKVLLPKEEELDNETSDEEDPRKELIEKLIEYKKFKNISLYFKDKEKWEGKILYKDPEYFPEIEEIQEEVDIELDLLCSAFKNILNKQDLLNSDNKLYHEVKVDTHTVEEMIDGIIEKMNKSNSIQFSTLFNQCNSRDELVTTFLAILELIRLKTISVNQDNLFDDFFIVKI